MKSPLPVLALLVALTLPAQAELKVPSIIGDHMVLQRDLANPVWGWAEPGDDVTVRIADQTASATAGDDGSWVVELEPMTGSPHALQMSIQSGDDSLVFSNVVVGEVWVCSGQSNMQWPVTRADDPDLEIPTADYPNIRLISVPQVGAQEVQDDFEGQWEICTPDTVGEFSAVGYFFGRQLRQSLGVPIGLIDNAWGGSAAEAWVSRQVLEEDGRFDDYLARWEEIEANFDYEAEMEEWKKKAAAARKDGKRPPRRPRDLLHGQHRPGNLWAGVLEPIIGYGIRGAIWYQGESNADRAHRYDDLFSLMISQWRGAWGQGDFPFYWVQLADFKPEADSPGESSWAELREAQTNTLELPNTGQAVIYDLGEARDIHPRDKQNVAKRLARIALARDYGWDVPYRSPSFESMKIDAGKATITFQNVGSGLYAFDTSEIQGFAMAGEDRVWHPAQAERVGKNEVVVTSEAVDEPVAVRYAWADNPVANLQSREGLPVVPFRTDDWPQVTAQESSEEE